MTRSWERLRRKVQKAGVRPLRLHDARHIYASLALAFPSHLDRLKHVQPLILGNSASVSL